MDARRCITTNRTSLRNLSLKHRSHYVNISMRNAYHLVWMHLISPDQKKICCFFQGRIQMGPSGLVKTLFDIKFHFHGKFWINYINLWYFNFHRYSLLPQQDDKNSGQNALNTLNRQQSERNIKKIAASSHKTTQRKTNTKIALSAVVCFYWPFKGGSSVAILLCLCISTFICNVCFVIVFFLISPSLDAAGRHLFRDCTVPRVSSFIFNLQNYKELKNPLCACLRILFESFMT